MNSKQTPKNVLYNEINDLDKEIARTTESYNRLKKLDDLKTYELLAKKRTLSNSLMCSRDKLKKLQTFNEREYLARQRNNDKLFVAGICIGAAAIITTSLVANTPNILPEGTIQGLMLATPIWMMGCLAILADAPHKIKENIQQEKLISTIAQNKTALEDVDLILWYKNLGKSFTFDLSQKIQDLNSQKQEKLTTLRQLNYRFPKKPEQEK